MCFYKRLEQSDVFGNRALKNRAGKFGGPEAAAHKNQQLGRLLKRLHSEFNSEDAKAFWGEQSGALFHPYRGKGAKKFKLVSWNLLFNGGLYLKAVTRSGFCLRF